MKSFFTTGTYASKGGRMLSFTFIINAPDMEEAVEMIVKRVQSRKGYFGKLSFDVVCK